MIDQGVPDYMYRENRTTDSVLHFNFRSHDSRRRVVGFIWEPSHIWYSASSGSNFDAWGGDGNFRNPHKKIVVK